jgi:anti-sigma regulatory factor (Ser/Thr protein kinase)
MSVATVDAANTERFVHPALFYADISDYVAGTVPFIEQGLSADEPVAVAVPGPNLRVLRDALGSAAAARVRMLDMTEVGANPGRIIPGVLRAFADAHPDRHVRIIGEPIWPGRTEWEYPACAQHEALINHAFTGRNVTILCPYDTTGLTPRVLADARATHPTLLDRSGQYASDQYDPDRVISGYNQPLPLPHSVAEIVVDSPSAVTDARRFATTHARSLGLSEARLTDLELAVAELVTNSVDHGGGTGLLRIWSDPHQVICEVTDSGQLTDPLAGRRPATPNQPRGRGLLLVNHIVDLVRIHTNDTSTTIRVHLRLPTPNTMATGTSA